MLNKKYVPLLLGGGALRPASISDIQQWLKGVESDGISIIDKKDIVNPEPEVRDVNCLSFDGATTYVDTGLPLNIGSADYSGSVTFKTSTLSAQLILEGRDGNDDGLRVSIINSVDFRVSHNTHDLIMTDTVTDGAWHTVDYRKVGTDLEARVDGGSWQTQGSVTGDIAVTTNGKVGTQYDAGAAFFNGQIARASLDGYFTYTMAEGNYADITTAFDVSGNGNDGAVTAGTSTTSDGVASWNHEKGFSLYEYVVLLLATIAPLDLIPDLTQIPV